MGKNTVMESMERDVTEHGVAFRRVGLENLIFPDEEGDVAEVVTFKELMYVSAGIPDPENRAENEDICEEEVELLSSEQELEVLALDRAILERHAELFDVRRKAFGSC